MTGRLVKPPPQSAEELVRSFEQRIRQLEAKQTTRVGEWVLYSDDEGRLLATKPGEVNDVGNPIVEAVDLGALRGFVTESAVAQAVSGGATSSLSVATQSQVIQDENTANAKYVADNAQALASTLDAKINAGAGYSFSDTFDRNEPTTLGDQYFRTQSGGAGAYGTDGSGLAQLTTRAGTDPQWWCDRHITPSTTDSMVVSTTLNVIPACGGSLPTIHEPSVRMNVDNTHRFYARITCNYIALAYTLGGAPVEVIPNQPFQMADGDSWRLIAAQAVDPTYILTRNDQAVRTWVDYNRDYPINSAHRFGGVRNEAGMGYSFWLPQQWPGPVMQVFNFADRV